MTDRVQKKVLLPSVVLGPSELTQFEERLDEILEQPTTTITISREGTEVTYQSFDAVIQDGLTDDHVKSFEVLIETDAGQARLSANSNETDHHTLFIEGENEWCDEIQTAIETTIKDYCSISNKIRTTFSGKVRMLFLGILSSIIAGEAYVILAPIGIFHPAGAREIQLYAITFIFASIFFATGYRHHFFPYVCWRTKKRGYWHIYTKGAAQCLGLSLLLTVSIFVLSLTTIWLLPILIIAIIVSILV